MPRRPTPRPRVTRIACLVAIHGLIMGPGPAQGAPDDDPERNKFQGQWEVTELVEDGRVLDADEIRDMLPSGGRMQVIDSAIIFRSPKDQRQRARMFQLTPTQYPRAIDFSDASGRTTRGIYQFDQGKLIVCIADPEGKTRPDAFSAAKDSQRMLMVLQRPAARPDQPAAPRQPPGRTTTPSPRVFEPPVVPPSSTAPAATKSEQSPTAREPSGTPSPSGAPATSLPKASLRQLSDDDIKKMAVGTWMLKDTAGTLFVTFADNGRFETVREYQELRLFHQSFVQTPVSSGSWKVATGTLSAYVGSSVDPTRVNRIFSFRIRSLTAADMIFVDPLGRVVRATRVRK